MSNVKICNELLAGISYQTNDDENDNGVQRFKVALSGERVLSIDTDAGTLRIDAVLKL